MENTFRFEEVRMLWLMAATLPVLGLFLYWSWLRKQVLIAAFVKSRLLASLTVGVSWRKQIVRSGLLAMATALLFVALARPQWGFSWQEATQRGLDIVVAVDTSKSMLAADLAPSRLERARLAALDLMELAGQDRLGLVAFAGSAFLQCPLTLDNQAFQQSVEILNPEVIPQGGTSLVGAIEIGLSAFDEENDNYKVIMILTDGEDHDQGAVRAATDAVEQGCRVFTVGLGSADGELIQVTDESGRRSFLKDASGNTVKSRLNEGLLREIAQAGKGAYILMRDADTLSTLYKNHLEPLPKGELSSRLVRQYTERFQWPLGLVILVLLGEVFISDQKRIPRTHQDSGEAKISRTP
jgi:Ca-activated chloride channel homolog